MKRFDKDEIDRLLKGLTLLLIAHAAGLATLLSNYKPLADAGFLSGIGRSAPASFCFGIMFGSFAYLLLMPDIDDAGNSKSYEPLKVRIAMLLGTISFILFFMAIAVILIKL